MMTRQLIRYGVLLAVALCCVWALPLGGGSRSEMVQTAAAAPVGQGGLPARWPSTLQLGMADNPGGAAAMKGTAPFGFRYQYLAGGANTGNGWATWNTNGQFVTYYVQDSVANGITPAFIYYMLLQSNGPCGGCAEKDKDLAHLNDTATMTALYNDLKLFYQRAGAFPNTLVVLNVEPDLWGYIQQAATNDNAATVPAKVAATGLSELAGLPNNAAGFAQAVRKLRDTYAPNVAFGYHLSIWGTGNDIQYSKPSLTQVDALATRSANFFISLGSDFDVAFGEFSDRDAAFYQYQYGDGGAHWMSADDFTRHARYMSTFSSKVGKRLVLWQIPLGNTKMRAMNNTWDHYQDNRVEWLLDDSTRAHLNTYLQAGVVAFLFGRGADGATCACDAANDGVTNPAPINNNTTTSLNADDDGGFFRQKAAAYYSAGPIPLSSGGTQPTSTPTGVQPSPTPTAQATKTNTLAPTATATNAASPSPTRTGTATPIPATPTATPATAPSYTTSASVSPSTVGRGSAVSIVARVTSATASSVLVDVEVYSPAGSKVFQQYYDNQTFTAGQQRQYTSSWTVPTGAATGTYKVKIGIFSPGWGTLYSWNDNAAQFVAQ